MRRRYGAEELGWVFVMGIMIKGLPSTGEKNARWKRAFFEKG
jgi:hypothetical protein